MIMRKLFNFIKSLKFAITILIIIAIVSAIGAVIPQERDAEFYIERYGKSLANFFEFSGFTDVYHSLYFIILLFLLTISLILCSIDTIPTLKLYFGKQKTLPSENKLKRSKIYREFEGEYDKDEFISSFKKMGYRELSGDDKRIILQKGVLSRINLLIVHLGIIVIILGGVLGWGWGEKAYITIFENETTYISSELGDDLTITAKSVEIVRDPNSGKIQSYETEIDIKKDDEIVKSDLLYVNSPVEYEGLKIYQENMGTSNGLGLVVEPVEAITDRYEYEDNISSTEMRNRMVPIEVIINDGEYKDNYRINPLIGEITPINTLDLSIEITNRFSHYTRMMGFDSNNNPRENPAIKYRIYAGDSLAFKGYAFEKYPQMSTTGKIDDTSIQVKMHPRSSLYGEEYMHSFVVNDRFPFPFINEEAKLTVGMTNDVVNLSLLGEDISLGKYQTEKITHKGEQYLITYIGPLNREYTGLSIKRDPGKPLFYIGSIILSISVIILVFGKYKRVEILFKPDRVMLGARTKGSPERLSKDINKILSKYGVEES